MSTHELVIDKEGDAYLKCHAKPKNGGVPECWKDGSCKAVEWVEEAGLYLTEAVVIPVELMWQGDDGLLLKPIKAEQR